MRMTKVYTITLDGKVLGKGDCPKWAKDFNGSHTQQQGGTITSQPVGVANQKPQVCGYCQRKHVRVL